MVYPDWQTGEILKVLKATTYIIFQKSIPFVISTVVFQKGSTWTPLLEQNSLLCGSS